MKHTLRLAQKRIDVTGDDAREWLGGQLTCDLRESAPGSSTYGLLLTTKGKIITDVWVLTGYENAPFALSVPESALPETLKRLERFLVMEDVDLEVSDEVLVSVQGGDSPGPGWWPVPRLDGPGWERWMSPEEAATHTTTSETDYEGARIEAGRPRLGLDMGNDTLPQEVGLHRAVAFDKGCYVGQEPVVMLEHRGKPPKRLVRLSVAGAEPGAEVIAGGASVGRVTSVHPSKELALALVRRKFLESDLQVGDACVGEVMVIGQKA